MKSMLNSNKKMSNSINISKLNGINSKENKLPAAYYLFSILVTNLLVYILSSSSISTDLPQKLSISGYSEIVLEIELMTPFKKVKKVNLYARDRLETYNDIYFLDLLQDNSQSFEASEKSKVVLYVPNKYISELSQSTQLIAIPFQTQISKPKQVTINKESHEIIY